MAKKKTQLHYNGPDLKRGRNVGSSDAHASSFLYFFLFLSYPFFLKKKKHEVLKPNHSNLQPCMCTCASTK